MSTRNILPGSSRPFLTIRSGAISRAPTSEAMITRSSSVTTKRPGRRPLRSSTAPIVVPSVKATDAGPSQASIRQLWYL